MITAQKPLSTPSAETSDVWETSTYGIAGSITLQHFESLQHPSLSIKSSFDCTKTEFRVGHPQPALHNPAADHGRINWGAEPAAFIVHCSIRLVQPLQY